MESSNSRALVFSRNKGKIFLVKRTKKGKPVFWTYPGGHSEKGETPIETLEREILEEIGIRICRIEEFFEYEFKGKKQTFFICKEAEEFERIKPTGEEIIDPDKDNLYEVVEVELEEIAKLDVMPSEMTEAFCFKYDLKEFND